MPEVGLPWCPEVLDPRDARQAERLDALQTDPAVELRDTVASQQAELARLRPVVPDELRNEQPRWVHYPWRRMLISVLGPMSFRRLRLDRNRNKITAEEQDQLLSLTIGVVGLSVGHVIAHTLVLEGLCGEIRLADFDTLEVSNLNRVPAGLADLGVNKAVVAARRISEVDPYIAVKVFTDGLNAANIDHFFEGVDIVLEECDSLDVKLAVRQAARRYQVPVIMETNDGGLLDVERFDLEPTRPVFHGLLNDLPPADLSGLSTNEKVPYVLRILEPTRLTARMAASMAEIDHTVTTWPQLAGDVTLGAASAAAAVRRIGRADQLDSGRVRIDLNGALDRLETPECPPVASTPPAEVTPPPEDVVAAMAHAAHLAPSGGNMQPWRFEIGSDELRVFVVPARSSTMDVGLRGSYVAIGAATFNARVAAAARGQLTNVAAFPESDRADLVASVRLRPGVEPALVDLYDAVMERVTNRRPGKGRPLPPTLLDDLTGAAAEEGGALTLVTGSAKIQALAEILAESDRLRYLSPVLHREMMSELRWPHDAALSTGIDVRTLELEPAELAKLPVAGRPDVMAHLDRWNGGRALGDVTRERVRSSSALAVLTVASDTDAALVDGGAALQRTWLTATRAGLAIQPVSPVFLYARSAADYAALVGGRAAELAGLAADFRQLLGLASSDHFVLVFRVSEAAPATVRSLRLPLASLVSRPAPSLSR